MTRPLRIVRNAAIGLVAFLLLATVTGILVVRTAWFRNYVREKIVTATAEGTGGRVDIGSFQFDWTHLTAVVTNFVIHGNEPAGATPYLRADRVEVHIRLFTSLHHLLDITYLGVQHPQANIMVSADGTSNVPKPKPSAPSGKAPLQTLIDLAVGHFDLTNGSVAFNSQQQNFDLHGESLHAQLWFNALTRRYTGQIAMAPLYMVNGHNTPVKFQLTLPVTLESDRIAFQNGQISTDHSHLTIDGALANLKDPAISAHVAGSVALADLKNAGNVKLIDTRPRLPQTVQLDVTASVARNTIDVSSAHVSYGASSIDASGRANDLNFHMQLALAELGRLTNFSLHPEGTLNANGTATLDAQHNYDVRADLNATALSFQGGTRRIREVSLSSSAHLTPQRLDLDGFRIGAFGADIVGKASLENFARYTVAADLHHLDLESLVPGYSATISGPLSASGDLHTLAANARLAIAPGLRGIPVSGRLNVGYRSDTGNLTVADSSLALPHTRVTLSGSLGNRLNVALNTTDLRDFAPVAGTLPVQLAGGSAAFTGAVSGRLDAPQIGGHLALDRFAVEGRQFGSLTGDVAASPSRAALSNGILRRGAMQTQLTAAVGLRDWKATPTQSLSVQATVRDGDLADVLALVGMNPAGYSGPLTADVNVTGTIGNLRGAANITIAAGAIDGRPIDSAQAQVTLADQLVTVPSAQIVAGPSRLQFTAEFRHPRDAFDRGQIHAHVQTTQLNLAQVQANSGGVLQATTDVSGDLRPGGDFLLTGVSGDASGRTLTFDGQSYGDFTATARSAGQSVTYTVNSNFAGSQTRVAGTTQLAPGYPTTAHASTSGLPIERLLALAHRTDIPAKGSLAATAHVTGPLHNPQGTVDAIVTRGSFGADPIDRLHVAATYSPASIDVSQFQLRSGPSILDATGRYEHGIATFRITRGSSNLASIKHLQQLKPGLGGTVQFTASGAVATGQQIQVRDLNLNLTGKGISADGKNLGDVTLSAATASGRTTFALDASFAGATIRGRGDAQLSGDYPVNARVSLQNVTWKGLQPLVGTPGTMPADFGAVADADVTVNGPVLRIGALNGNVIVSRLQVTAAQNVTIQNQGPLVVALDRGGARIQSFHLTGPQTDIQVSGTVSLTAQTWDANLNGHTDLSLLKRFDRDIDSSGQIVTNATLRGTFAKPLINGNLALQNATVEMANLPVGLSNANGAVDFNGTNAQFRNLTGEVGGGKVVLSGFVSYSDVFRMAVRVNATQVRYRVQPGVSVVADADLRLVGRTAASIVSGTVTIDRINYAPQSDFGAILSRAAPPVQVAANPSPFAENMKLDVAVRTSSATAVQASLAQNLQMDANLRLQGTAATPGLTGRVVMSEGKLNFFSSTYTVNTGTISFFNPFRIEPILDLSLETRAKGVDVTLRVTGPIDNMKLSYTSEPPIPFNEIVSLLAAGTTPTSDPTLLANQPAQPPQTFQQMGESAILANGLADPISNRLQRVFGLTQFRIEPAFSGTSGLPTARATLQQQITSRLTLTYTTALNDPSLQSESGEFTLSRQWSATAIRDEYGLFSIRFQFKTQFR